MPDIDNKVVSISFNNKQFMDDISETIVAIEKLNDATSGKNINTSGFDNLRRVFHQTTDSISSEASDLATAISKIQNVTDGEFKTGGIDGLRKALENAGVTAIDVEDTIAELQQLSKTGVSYAGDLGVANMGQEMRAESEYTRNAIIQDVDDVSDEFNMLRLIGTGAMIAIGEKVIELGSSAFSNLTSGLRDGWAEYNSLTNSTQTILANTERWGTTMDDVTSALNELNNYADLTTYAFSDMTRNIGYFTTAGVNLEDSVTAIQGLSNVGALFGADAQAVARAGYQISQAMSAGVIKLMDWRSMINAGMGGKVLQDELIRTAAVMSGTSIDAMNEYIESLGGFNASLQEGWLTSDIFLEAMRTFAGQTKEYYESLTDASGNRLYSDEEIDQLVRLGETAMESATKVKTFQQMMDAFRESIGSGWQRTFSYIVGDLEEAKEFWTPINDVLTNIVNGFFSLQNGALAAWDALGGRRELIEGIMNILESIQGVLSAVGNAFLDVFGNEHIVGNRLFQLTEALTDFTESLKLSDDELQDLRDFVGGLLEPLSLIVDVIFELVRAFFNAGDAMNEFDERTDSIMDGTKDFRRSILTVLGIVGRVLKAGAEFIKKNQAIQKVIKTFATLVKNVVSTIIRVVSAPFALLYQLWERYNIGEKLEELWIKIGMFFLPIIDAVKEVKAAFEDWFSMFKTRFGSAISDLGGPIEILVNTFTAVKQLFKDLFDPTVSVSDAFSNFIDTVKEGGLGAIFETIKDAVSDLWDRLKDTAIGQWFIDLKDKIQNAWQGFLETPIGQCLSDIVESIKEFIGVDTFKWDNFWETTESVITTIADGISTGWAKIKSFFGELIDIIKDWFGLSDEASNSVEDATSNTVGAVNDTIMNGTLSELPGLSESISFALMTIGDAAEYAEKHTPDAESSKFLEFLRKIPEVITNVYQTIADSQVVQNISDFFRMIVDPVKEFFNMDLSDQKDSILEWFASVIEKVEDLIGGLLGIPDFQFGEYGIFETIAMMISSMIEAFSGISKNALQTVKDIIDYVIKFGVMVGFVQLANTASNIAVGLKEAGKAFKLSQAAANNTAKAAKWAAIGHVIISFALALLAVVASIALISKMLENEDNKIGWAIGIVIGIIAAITVFMILMTRQAKKIKPGSMRGIADLLQNLAIVILSIILAIAGLIGITYLLSYILSTSDTTAFTIAAIIVGALFLSILFFIGFLVSNASKLVELTQSAKELGKVSAVLNSLSGILVSIGIVMVTLIGSIILLTYFLSSLTADKIGAFIGAIVMTVVLLGMALGTMTILMVLAKHLGSVTSSTDPKKFSKIIMYMSLLLLAITTAITTLMLAMAGFVYVIDIIQVDNPIAAMATAAIIVAALLSIIMYGIYEIMKPLNAIVQNKVSHILAALAIPIVILIGISAMVISIAMVAHHIAENTSNVWNIIGVLGSVIALLIAVIFSVSKVIDIISNMDLRKLSDKRILRFTGILMGVLFAILSISASLSLVILAIGAGGLNGLDALAVMASIGGMMIIAAGIIAGMAFLVDKNIVKVESMQAVAITLAIASLCILSIGASIAMIAAALEDIDSWWAPLASLAGILFLLSAAIGILSLIAKTGYGSIIAAGAALAIAAAGLLFIAAAMGMIADIDTDKLLVVTGTLGILFVALSVVMGILAAIAMGTGGIGAVVILAVAGALVVAATSFLIFAESLKTSAEAVETFINAIASIQNIDADLIVGKLDTLIAGINRFTQGLTTSAGDIATSVFLVISGLIRGITIGLIAGWTDGIEKLHSAIVVSGPLLVTVLTQLGMLILTAIHNVGLGFVEMVIEDFGPGGAIRNVATAIGDFIAWLSTKAMKWAIDIVDGALMGFIEATEDGNRIRRIALSLRLLFLQAKDNLLSYLNIPDFEAIGTKICLSIFQGLFNMASGLLDSEFGQAFNSALEEITGYDLAATIDSFGTRYQHVLDNLDTSGATQRAEEINDVREAIDELSRTIDGTAGDIEEDYKGVTAAASGAASSSDSFMSTVISGVRDLLGISDDFSITDMLGGFTEGLGEGLSEGGFDISSLLGNLGGISDIVGGIDTTDMFNVDTSGLSNASIQLGDISAVMSDSEFSNPVITPDVDTTNVELGISNIEDMFNNANIGEIALDVGNSMTVRENAEGDTATDGNVSYNFTQYNYSPEAQDPITIYRETNNLFRMVKSQ